MDAEIIPTPAEIKQAYEDKDRAERIINLITHDPNAPPKITEKLNYTDLGNAKRLIELFGADILYCYPWSSWVTWNTQRWIRDEYGEIDRMAKLTVRQMHLDGLNEIDSKKSDEIIEFALKSESESRINAMIKLAKSEPGIPVSPDKFDIDNWLFNVQNGTIDLTKGELRDVRREDYISKISPVVFNDKAERPVFDKFINRIFENDEEMINYIQKVLGRCLTGDVTDEEFYILWGGGGNGKSKLVEIVDYILSDYSWKMESKSLMIKKDEGISHDIASLQGKRFVWASETATNKQLNEALVKQLSGDIKLTAEKKYESQTTFIRTLKPFLLTNNKPIIKGIDGGIKRRLRFIPFIVKIPEDEKDRKMTQKLQAESSGILNWLIEGCLKWQVEGLKPPEAVLEATDDYFDEMDTMIEFIENCCIKDPSGHIPNPHIFKIYNKWCDYSKSYRMSDRSFTQAIGDRGYRTKKVNGIRSKLGIRLIPALEDAMKQMDAGTLSAETLEDMNIGEITQAEAKKYHDASMKILRDYWDKHKCPEPEDMERFKRVSVSMLLREIAGLDDVTATNYMNEYIIERKWDFSLS